MLSKKVLLIGKGHLGSYLKELWSIPAEMHWTREMADLDVDILKRLAPDAVINTAGKTDLRWCEDNAAECFRCNVAAPIAVYRAVKAAFGPNVPFIQLSSGCVWDGPYNSKGKAFEPSDAPLPACFYAWTKSACDALMLREIVAPLLILRPRQVYSPLSSARNTLTKLNSYSKLLDTPNSMTSADTIAKTIEVALAAPDERIWNRILLVYERGISSPFEVGTFLAQAGCRKLPEKLTKNDLDKWHKPKRVDTVLFDEFFEKTFQPPNVQDELKRNIRLYAKAIPS